jgi:hypothetical protein
VIFETAFSKLEKDLGVKRQSIAKLVDQVGAVFARRDEAVAKLKDLQEAAENSASDVIRERKMN